MKAPILLSTLLLACASPAPQFMGTARGEAVLGGIRFTVFHDGSQAEVIRHGYLTRAQRGPVPGLMIRAAERVSGCRVVPGSVVTGLPGDTGEARMDLDCAAG